MESLYGSKPFYEQSDYQQTLAKECCEEELLTSDYTWTPTEQEGWWERCTARVYAFIHSSTLIKKELLHKFLPAVDPAKGYPELAATYTPNYLSDLRKMIPVDKEFMYRRVRVRVEQNLVDAWIVGKAATLRNGRWLVAANGRGSFAEEKLSKQRDFKQILAKTDSNGIVFNYPHTGASKGVAHKTTMEKAHRAILSFVKDQKEGLKAKEVILFGHSMGGGVQGSMLNNHPLENGQTKFVAVKSKTFSSFAKVASLESTINALVIRLFGWNFNSIDSSKASTVPELVISSAHVTEPQIIHHKSQLKDDGTISVEGSLAGDLMEVKDRMHLKVFIGVPGMHDDEYSDDDTTVIADQINLALQTTSYARSR